MALIALIDLVADGHHPIYLRYFAQALAAAGHDIVVFFPDVEKLASVRNSPRICVITVSKEPAPSRHKDRLQVRYAALNRLRFVHSFLLEYEESKRSRFDLVLFAYLDQFIGQGLTRWDIERRLARPFTGLYFNLTHFRCPQRYPWLRRGPLNPDHVLTSTLCRGLAVLDEGVANRLSNKLGQKLVVPLPDVAPMDSPRTVEGDAEELAVRLTAAGRTVVGLVGCLDKRKGLMDFFSLASLLQNERFFFLAAGPVEWQTFSPDECNIIQAIIKSPPNNLRLIDRWLADVPNQSLLRSCDILYIAYRRFFNSSSMLTRAAALRAPVLASNYGLIAERVMKFGIGFVVPEGNIAAMATLLRAGDLISMKSQDSFADGCAAYLLYHNTDRLKTELEKLVNHCISI